MDQYVKGKNFEEELTTTNIPISILPEKFGWLLVSGSTKIRTSLGPATKQLKEEGSLVLAGSGNSTPKVVSIAEIIKRRNKGVHQITKIGIQKVEEHWEPKTEDLDPIVVTRQIPTIYILLSKTELDSSQLGYQGPNFSKESLWRTDCGSGRKKPGRRNNPKGRKNAEELGLANSKWEHKGKEENKKGKEKNFHKKGKENEEKSAIVKAETTDFKANSGFRKKGEGQTDGEITDKVQDNRENVVQRDDKDNTDKISDFKMEIDQS